jgi:hypothetical protein
MNRFIVALSCVLLISFVNSHSLEKKDDKSGEENASKKVSWCEYHVYYYTTYIICDYCIICVYIFFHLSYIIFDLKEAMH